MSAVDAVPDVIVREPLARHAPLALRLIDVVNGAPVSDQLVVEISRSAGGSPVTAFPSRAGVWTAFGVPGLRRYEFGSDDSVAARRAARRRFRISVRDSAGRYLPFAFDADLPTDTLIVPLPAATALPIPPWRGGATVSPPVSVLDGIPLFPSPARTMPQPIATIGAELREAGTGQPAAWALLQATIGVEVRGLGLADALGRVCLMMPYPPLPTRLSASPPAPAASRWNVTLGAFYQPATAGPVPDVPDLAAILAQFAHPRRLLADVDSPPITLPAVELDEGIPLVVRTIGPSTPSPFLLLDAA